MADNEIMTFSDDENDVISFSDNSKGDEGSSSSVEEGSWKILIVDDDPMNIDILMDDLEDLYTLRSAESGEEALQIIPDFHPDLILLDIMMSGIDGYEVCRRIRADEKYNAIKIILISGRAMENERQKGYAVGADDYVTKPFEVEELVEKIRKLDDMKNDD